MKKVIFNLLVFGLVCFTSNAISQNPPIMSQNDSTQKMVMVKTNSDLQIKERQRPIKKMVKSDIFPVSISSITSAPDRVKYQYGFLVGGTAGPNKNVEVYNKVHWKQKGYNYVRAKEYDPIKITADNDGKWEVKVEGPYIPIPATAYDIKFEISSKQFPYPLLATLPPPSIVYGTMAPPEIKQTDGSIQLNSRAGPGGQYRITYTTISGKGIPNMDIKISVATEYQSPIRRYSRGDEDNMRTRLSEGESKTVKITSNGNWSVKVEVPNPHNGYNPHGVSNFKLVVKAIQSASSSDVSKEAEKKFNISSY